MSTNIPPYKVKVGEFVFSFFAEELAAMDVVKKSDGVYHVIKNNQSVQAIINDHGGYSKKINVEVAGENFLVEIKDELDQMLEVMGFGMASTKQVKEIKAPMPGLVLEISVSQGQEVKEGNRLLILEAMKMENSIMIHRDAVIKEIKVKPGQAVEKNQVLIELE